MAKEKKTGKCKNCGHKIALASVYLMDVEVEFDQEPYDADVVEPVYIDKIPQESMFLDVSITCHVCPNCKWVQDFEKNEG